MKMKILFGAACLVAPLFAADGSKILLRGASVSVEEARVVGEARATVGDLNVTADAIAFDRLKNVLKCEGTVTVRTASAVMRTKDCVIELAAGEKKLFFLDQGEIQIFSKPEPMPTSLVPPSK